MPKPRAGRKLPAEMRLPDFRRRLEHFDWSVERCGSGEYKARNVAPDGRRGLLVFGTVSGRRVKREYVRQAINRLGVTKEQFMDA